MLEKRIKPVGDRRTVREKMAARLQKVVAEQNHARNDFAKEAIRGLDRQIDQKGLIHGSVKGGTIGEYQKRIGEMDALIELRTKFYTYLNGKLSEAEARKLFGK